MEGQNLQHGPNHPIVANVGGGVPTLAELQAEVAEILNRLQNIEGAIFHQLMPAGSIVQPLPGDAAPTLEARLAAIEKRVLHIGKICEDYRSGLLDLQGRFRILGRDVSKFLLPGTIALFCVNLAAFVWYHVRK